MGEFRPPVRTDYGPNDGEAWWECHLCGPRVYRALVHFKQGNVAPTVGETVTGASSADTGVIANVTLTGGTYAGGDATGVIEMTSPTGYDAIILEIFTAEESLNGSTSGNAFAVATKTGAVQVWGKLIPEKEIVHYEGRDYCRSHFLFKFANTWKDEADVDDDESDREV